jgi:hypothetical protein
MGPFTSPHARLPKFSSNLSHSCLIVGKMYSPKLASREPISLSMGSLTLLQFSRQCHPMNLSSLSAGQLRKAATLKERIDTLNDELAAILGVAAEPSAADPIRRRTLPPAAIAKIRAAAKARWARVRSQGANGRRPRRKMSSASRARLATIAKARWKRAKAEGRMAL